MIKKASELGLNVIEYDDHILLTRGSEIRLDDPDPSKMKYAIELSNLVESTTPIEKTLLLVIEDEVNEITKNEVPDRIYKTGVNYAANEQLGFKKGYNKAKETYKFTEEDLRGVFLIGLMENISGILNERKLDESEVESLFQKQLGAITKKELWIEVEETLEDNGQMDHTSYPTYVKVPKITNNQIKGVWK